MLPKASQDRGPRTPDSSTDPDAVLIVRARLGVPDALGALYSRYAERLHRVAFHLMRSEADAEDVVHDLFVGLPEALRTYQHRGQLGSWLRSVTVRLALIRMRRERRRARFHGPSAAATTAVAPVSDPWTAVDLARAIDALPEGLRTVFVLRQLEGLSHDHVASLLGLTSGAVRVRYVRALRQLRRHLEPES